MTQHDAGTPPTRRVRMVQVTWSYSPAHNLRRANAIAVAVAGRLNEHVYVLAPCRYGHGETIDLFFAAHADCTCSDEALQDLIQRVIAPLAEHSCFDVLPPQVE